MPAIAIPTASSRVLPLWGGLPLWAALILALGAGAGAAPPARKSPPSTIAATPPSNVSAYAVPLLTLQTTVERGGTFAELSIKTNRAAAITVVLYELFHDSPTAVTSAATLDFKGHRAQFFDLRPNTIYSAKLIAVDLATNKQVIRYEPFLTLRRRVTVRFPMFYCADDSDDFSSGELEIFVAMRTPADVLLDSDEMGSEAAPLQVPSGDIFESDLSLRSKPFDDSIRVQCWVHDFDNGLDFHLALGDRTIDIGGGTFMTLGTSNLAEAEKHSTGEWWNLEDLGIEMDVFLVVEVDYVP